jgi:hypothetical protein
MRKQQTMYKLALLGCVLALIAAACSTAGTSGYTEEEFNQALNTAVAATVTAQALDIQRTRGAEAALSPTETTAPTNTSAPDTDTPEPTLTPTPEPETTEESAVQVTQPVFTLSGPSVQVSIDTNCRSGPGKTYTYLGALLVGEEAQIVGKDPSGAYWYITNPDHEGEYCWIWGAYAYTAGNTAPLPVYTPGPTPKPEPEFSVGYREVESCGGAWQVEFEIVNTGVLTLQSVSTYVKDTVTKAESNDSSLNAFIKMTGCTEDEKHGKREPGETGFTVSLDLSNDPTGHLTYASVTVCSEDDLYGKCSTKEFYFTP